MFPTGNGVGREDTLRPDTADERVTTEFGLWTIGWGKIYCGGAFAVTVSMFDGGDFRIFAALPSGDVDDFLPFFLLGLVLTADSAS